MNAHGSSGAGHGGYGGKGYLQDIRGGFYNSISQPNMYGSSGGGGKTQGGGVLRVVSETLKIDGDIKADGQSGTSVTGPFNGGASGGSIWLTGNEIDGSGTVSVNGGEGDSLSGGGSGGRIAMHFSMHNKFEGSLTAYGGNSAHEAGAAGTVVSFNSKTKEMNLTVANKGRKPSSPRIADLTKLSIDAARTWIPLNIAGPKSQYKSAVIGETLLDYQLEYDFNVLTLGGFAHIAFEQSRLAYTSVISASQLYGTYEGGSFGYIHAFSKQLIVVSKSDFYVPVNLQIYQDGAVQLPSKVMLHKNDLNLQGSLCGLRELSISAGTLTVSSSSKVSYFLSGSPGFDLDKLTVYASASIVVSTESLSMYRIKSTELEIQAGGRISGRSLQIDTQTCNIRDSSVITVDFAGPPKTQGTGYGPTDTAAKSSCGASHAGYGSCPASLSPGSANGNMFQPSSTGSGGGGLSAVTGGSEGGGAVKITAVDLLVDGTITAKYELIIILILPSFLDTEHSWMKNLLHGSNFYGSLRSSYSELQN